MKEAKESSRSRYVVSVEDVGGNDSRELWIGGGHLKITDSQTGELLAERIGFVRGLLLGDHLAGPWSKVVFCPGNFKQHPSTFIAQVLSLPISKPAPEGAPR